LLDLLPRCSVKPEQTYENDHPSHDRADPAHSLHSFCGRGDRSVLGMVASSRAISQPPKRGENTALRKIAPWVTQHTAEGKQAEFLVILADQADLHGAAALLPNWKKVASFRDTLWNKSQTNAGSNPALAE
jgi:hypothetical protein